MDEAAVVSLALTLSFQAVWQQKRRNDPNPVRAALRVYTREDAIALGRRFGNGNARKNPTLRQSNPWILQHIDGVFREIQRYESQRLQELALEVIPFETLNTQAARIQAEKGLEYQDALVQALVEWAKKDFLKWADPIKCSTCGGNTEGVAGGTPTDEERSHGAGRVELYRCTNDNAPCKGHITRFPRYGSLEKLLQTRIGRCGEFAAVFMLLLRSLNLRARYIWNSEDHVWNEYYSDTLKRWVHVDSCEGARDTNLLYDEGWGKKMKYCIAFGIDGVKDVSRSYVSDWQATLARRDPKLEVRLRNRLDEMASSLREHLSAEDEARMSDEDKMEETWLADSETRVKLARQEKLSGRTSGTKEWRSMRSEIGGSQVTVERPVMTPVKLIMSSDDATERATVSGKAKVDTANSQIILTEDKADQIASSFLALPAGLQEFIFSSTFTISHQGGEGADGMAIVLHSDPAGVKAVGRGGCDLGYGGLKNCLAIELDTYRSVDRCDDPPTPHVSVHTAGSGAVSAHHQNSLWCSKPGTLPALDDGRPYTVRIEVSLPRQELRIFLNDRTERDFVEVTNGPLRLLTVPEGGYKCFGWTAATGGLHQSHVISEFELWEGQSREDAP